MKVALIFLVVVSLAQFGYSDDVHPDDQSRLRCIVDGAQATAGHVVGGAQWIAETTIIAIELLRGYRECQAHTSTIRQQACMASWGIDALIAANRVRHGLARITSPEVADGFYYHFLSCLGITDPQPPEH